LSALVENQSANRAHLFCARGVERGLSFRPSRRHGWAFGKRGFVGFWRCVKGDIWIVQAEEREELGLFFVGENLIDNPLTHFLKKLACIGQLLFRGGGFK
jgi:hypothetical protein